MNRSIRTTVIGLGLLALSAAGPGEGVLTATRSVHVQPSGPRTTPGMDRFFDIDGPGIDEAKKYAGFSFLDFPAPKSGERPAALTLALTQRVDYYTLDGRVKFYLVADVAEDLIALTKELRFDLASPDGLAGRVAKKVAVGSGVFTRKLPGEVDSFPLTLDAEARKVLDAQIKAGTIRILVVPDEPKVVATYLGAGPNIKAEKRPRLVIGPSPSPAR